MAVASPIKLIPGFPWLERYLGRALGSAMLHGPRVRGGFARGTVSALIFCNRDFCVSGSMPELRHAMGAGGSTHL